MFTRPPIRLSMFVDMNRSKLMHRNLFEGVAQLASKPAEVKVQLWPLSQRGFLDEHPCTGIIA